MSETKKERLDRELNEMLGELRVALPGAQVLFAFLLAVAFSSRFDTLSDTDRVVYVAAVLLSAISTGLLIAPSAHHRIRFRRRVKEGILKVGTFLTLVGLMLLILAIGCVIYLVIETATNATLATWCAVVVAGGTLLIWFALPYFVDGQELDDPEDEKLEIPSRA